MGCFQSLPKKKQESFGPPKCVHKGRLVQEALPKVELSLEQPLRELNTLSVEALWTPSLNDYFSARSNASKHGDGCHRRGSSYPYHCYCCGELLGSELFLLKHLLKGRKVNGVRLTEESLSPTLPARAILKMLLVLDLRHIKSFVNVTVEDDDILVMAVGFPGFYQCKIIDPEHSILLLDGKAPPQKESIVPLIRKDTYKDTRLRYVYRLNMESVERSAQFPSPSTTCPHCRVRFKSSLELAFHLVEQYASPDAAGVLIVKQLLTHWDTAGSLMEKLEKDFNSAFRLAVTRRVEGIQFLRIEALPPPSVSPFCWMSSEHRFALQSGSTFLLLAHNDRNLEDYCLQTWNRFENNSFRCPHCGEIYSPRDSMVEHYIRYMCPWEKHKTMLVMMNSIRTSRKPIFLSLPDGTCAGAVVCAPNW